MSNSNITDNKNTLKKTCSILLTVIFFILSFLTGFNNLVTFILGILTLAIIIMQSYKSIKGSIFYTLVIILIPVTAYGIIMSLSFFASGTYSISTRIFLPFNILLFLIAGFFSQYIKNFDFKWIFRGIFLGLSIICLINVITTSIYYGPFYGLRIPYDYSYYDGTISRTSVSASAYAMVGFSLKEVPIEYYLIYPMLLLTSIFFYLLGDRKDKYNIISTVCFILISLISLFFVISKISAMFVLIYLIFILLITLLLVYKKLYSKSFKITLYVVFSLSILFAVIFLINSQYGLVGFRNIIASNRLLNYVFNTNRYSENARVVLNGVFSMEKLIGFPVYFDFSDYALICAPTNNIIINQFMYGGLFGFIFFSALIAIYVYVFNKTKQLPIKDKIYKYFPLLFTMSYFAITLVCDQNSFDMVDYNLVMANYLSPFFYISLFTLGHYYSLANKGVTIDEA